jgi:DNA-binding GntR family transcriptional regulator
LNFSEQKYYGKPLGEQAYEAIRDAIITLRLPPGQMVFENQLAGTFGISRTPVREAIRKLTVEELIEVLPQRGSRIAFISEQKVKETVFVRESLETSAFCYVAKLWNAKDDRCREMQKQILHNLEEQRLAQHEPEKFLHLDEQFHRLILQFLGNSTLLTVIFHMRGHLNRVRYLALEQLNDMGKLYKEHEALFHSITRNDEAETARVLKTHLNKMKGDLPHLKASFPHYFKS